MGSSSMNTFERNERRRKGKCPAATRNVPSQNSKSPPSVRSGGLHIGQRKACRKKPNTHRQLSSNAINKKLRRFLDFAEATSRSTDSSMEFKKEKFEKHMKLFYEGLAEVDKLLGKVVSKFSPDMQKQMLESPSDGKVNEDGNGSSEGSIEFINHICVLVYSGHPSDEGVWYEMNPRDRFKHIFEDYAAKLDTTPEKILLHCTGCYISMETTVEDSGVKDGDYIGVKGSEDYYFNTNTHLKQVTIVEAVDKDPVKWTTTFAPSEDMIEVYNRWAEYAGYKYKEFYLMHNMVEIPRVGKLSDYPIKNGSILYCGKYLANQIWGEPDKSEEF